MHASAATRKDVERWISLLGTRMLLTQGTPGLMRSLFSLREGFRSLLKKKRPDQARFRSLVGEAHHLFIECESRYYEAMEKRKSRDVILDTDEKIVVLSHCSRQEGERDLYRERDRKRLEEAYLFVSHRPRKGKAEHVWIEVGNREEEDQAEISLFQVGAILRRFGARGKVLFASLYHYHPGHESTARNESRISVPDLMMAAKYYSTVAPAAEYPIDFRVVNFDGIYAYSLVTFDKLSNFSNTDLYRVNILSGKRLERLLRSHGIPCSFHPRKRKAGKPAGQGR